MSLALFLLSTTLLHSDLLLSQAFTVIVLLKIIILATILFGKEEPWVFLQFGSRRVLSSSVSWWCVPPVTRSGLLQALLILLCCFLSNVLLKMTISAHCLATVLCFRWSSQGKGQVISCCLSPDCSQRYSLFGLFAGTVGVLVPHYTFLMVPTLRCLQICKVDAIWWKLRQYAAFTYPDPSDLQTLRG